MRKCSSYEDFTNGVPNNRKTVIQLIVQCYRVKESDTVYDVNPLESVQKEKLFFKV